MSFPSDAELIKALEDGRLLLSAAAKPRDSSTTLRQNVLLLLHKNSNLPEEERARRDGLLGKALGETFMHRHLVAALKERIPSEGSWPCSACTFLNQRGSRQCEMCGTKSTITLRKDTVTEADMMATMRTVAKDVGPELVSVNLLRVLLEHQYGVALGPHEVALLESVFRRISAEPSFMAQVEEALARRPVPSKPDEKEAALAAAARRQRDIALKGPCSICLDAPSVAMLCCGTAVHVQCLVKWMMKSKACMVCRKPISEPDDEDQWEDIDDDDEEDDEDEDNGDDDEGGENHQGRRHFEVMRNWRGVREGVRLPLGRGRFNR